MVTDTPTYRCFLCGFRIDPELCKGRFIHAWKVTVCSNCLAMNRGGIQPTKVMVAKLQAARVNLTINKAGKIDWPEAIDMLIAPAERAPRQPKRPRRSFLWKNT
jgi:hypothetical protein